MKINRRYFEDNRRRESKHTLACYGVVVYRVSSNLSRVCAISCCCRGVRSRKKKLQLPVNPLQGSRDSRLDGWTNKNTHEGQTYNLTEFEEQYD